MQSPWAKANVPFQQFVAASADVKTGSAVAEFQLSKEQAVSESTQCRPHSKFPPFSAEHMVDDVTQLKKDPLMGPFDNHAPVSSIQNVETAEGTELCQLSAMQFVPSGHVDLIPLN